MLISLKVNNCFIYNDEIEFSMRANMHYKKFPSNVIRAGKVNILKSAMIVGPNNAGKTNFIHCLQAMRDIMLNSGNVLQPNLFFKNSICELSIVFYEHGEYIFEIKYDVKSHEFIYERFAKVTYDSSKNRKETDILVRDFVNDIYHSLDDQLTAIMGATARNNILIYLLDTKQFLELEKVKATIVSFAAKIDIVDMNNIPIQKTIDMLKMPSESKDKVVRFVLNADLSMDDFRYMADDEVRFKVNIDGGSKNVQENALKSTAPLLELLHLTSIYHGVPVPSVVFDSTGTKKIAALASYVISALEQGRILIVDEIDNSLHFKLTRSIISLFNNELNKHAQLICTVHDVTLLDCKRLFRKEQIWFAHKDEVSAYLYSLAEFTAQNDQIRDTSDLVEKYKKGLFGALPEPDLFQSLLEVSTNGQTS